MKNRNENRMFALLMELATLWNENCPDFRFMQLIVNFQSWLGSDGFYIEDDKLIEYFKDFMEGLHNGY